jgi:hypothetical protein
MHPDNRHSSKMYANKLIIKLQYLEQKHKVQTQNSLNNFISDMIRRTVILDNSCWDTVHVHENPCVGLGVLGRDGLTIGLDM